MQAAPLHKTTVFFEVFDLLDSNAATQVLHTFAIAFTNRIVLEEEPACYNGVVVVGEALRGACSCAPGAYGDACEFRHCPRDCSGAGVCDRHTGVCKCNNGFDGIDCAGKRPQCYVSQDGTCPEEDHEVGSFVFDSGTALSLNYAAGRVPSSLVCDGRAHPNNEFDCGGLSTVEFCCRDETPPPCPFMTGSAPCDTALCPYVAAADFGIASTAAAAALASANATARGVCKAAVESHCYAHADDPACNAFGATAVPNAACPLGVTIAHCAADLTRPGCDTLLPGIASFQACNFVDGPASPCLSGGVAGGDDVCAASPFSLGCRPSVSTYCKEHAGTDRECEIHGIGDRCFFLPDSAPCRSAACYVHGFDSHACSTVIQSYCANANNADPECLARGFDSGGVLDGLLDGQACPWDVIEAACEGSQRGEGTGVCATLLLGRVDASSNAATAAAGLEGVGDVRASLVALHAEAVAHHRRQHAIRSLLSILSSSVATRDSGVFSANEMAVLLSTFSVEGILSQFYAGSTWDETLTQTLLTTLREAGHATEAEVEAALESHAQTILAS